MVAELSSLKFSPLTLPPDPPPVPGSLSLPLEQLTVNSCRWPIGRSEPHETPDGDYVDSVALFCGLPSTPPWPYCKAHAAVAYRPRDARAAIWVLQAALRGSMETAASTSAVHHNASMTPKTTPSKPPAATPIPSAPIEPPDDKILTVRLAPELYEAIITEAKAARHSINSAATILLEEALEARGKWTPPKGPTEPFWKSEPFLRRTRKGKS